MKSISKPSRPASTRDAGVAPTRLGALAETMRELILNVPEGTLIGRETELCETIGCTRSILRQVSRQLEMQGLLVVRRGPAGGYFAARPSIETVVEMAAGYFIARRTPLSQALDAVMSCTLEAVRLAAACPETSPAYHAMKTLADEIAAKIPEDMGSGEFGMDECRIDEAIFEMINIEPLEVFIKILNRFSLGDFEKELFSGQPEHRKIFRGVRMTMVAAILRHDADEAVRAMAGLHALVHDWLPKSAKIGSVGEVAAARVAPRARAVKL